MLFLSWMKREIIYTMKDLLKTPSEGTARLGFGSCFLWVPVPVTVPQSHSPFCHLPPEQAPVPSEDTALLLLSFLLSLPDNFMPEGLRRVGG